MGLHINWGPRGRRLLTVVTAAFLLFSIALLAPANRTFAADAAFAQWLAAVWPDAQAMGVSRAKFETATRGLEPDFSLPDAIKKLREWTKPQGEDEGDAKPTPQVAGAKA